MMRKEKNEPVADQEPRSETGSRSFVAYTVEAKLEHFVTHKPVYYSCPYHKEKILTDTWQEIYFFEGNNPAGIPIVHHTASVSLLDKTAALALAYTFAAQNSRGLSDVLVRIVPYEVHTTYKKTQKGQPVQLTKGLLGEFEERIA